MEEDLNIRYDQKGDVLDLSIGEPKEAISREISEDVFARIGGEEDKIIGLMILNFQKHLEDSKKNSIALNISGAI